jgi:pSer/pThr/pTyr-binding forkhead associated (FHA) protein
MLYSLTNNSTSEVHTFDSELIRVGRSAQSDLKLEGKGISRLHCEMKVQNGILYLNDLNSLTGVFVNGKRVENSCPLKNNDRLRLGECEFSLSIDTQADEDATVMFEANETAVLSPPLQGESKTVAIPSINDSAPACILVSPNKESLPLKLKEQVATVGRSPLSEAQLFDPSISLQHAKIISKNGTLHLRDLNSTNGSYLNGKKLDANKDYRIDHSDNVKFGDDEFSIEIPGFIEDTKNRKLWVKQFAFFVLANAIIIAWALWRAS